MHAAVVVAPLAAESNDEDGVMQLIMIEDSADCANFGVHLSDQAATMQKMWSQMMGRLPPEAAPQCKRGLNMALCSFGFLQSTSGLSPRPNFPLQQRTLDYLHDKIKD